MEIFNIDSGWNVEALEDVAHLLGGDSDGWSVEAADSGNTADGGADEGGWSVVAVGEDEWVDDGDDDDDDEAEEGSPGLGRQAGTSGGPSGAAVPAQPATFNGRVLRSAEEQLLASLPRHQLRRLEAEQREADEGGWGHGGASQLCGMRCCLAAAASAAAGPG